MKRLFFLLFFSCMELQSGLIHTLVESDEHLSEVQKMLERDPDLLDCPVSSKKPHIHPLHCSLWTGQIKTSNFLMQKVKEKKGEESDFLLEDSELLVASLLHRECYTHANFILKQRRDKGKDYTVEKKALMRFADGEGSFLSTFTLLTEYGTPLDEKSSNEVTCLQTVIHNKKPLDCLMLLLRAGADVNVKSKVECKELKQICQRYCKHPNESTPFEAALLRFKKELEEHNEKEKSKKKKKERESKRYERKSFLDTDFKSISIIRKMLCFGADVHRTPLVSGAIAGYIHRILPVVREEDLAQELETYHYNNTEIDYQKVAQNNGLKQLLLGVKVLGVPYTTDLSFARKKVLHDILKKQLTPNGSEFMEMVQQHQEEIEEAALILQKWIRKILKEKEIKLTVPIESFTLSEDSVE